MASAIDFLVKRRDLLFAATSGEAAGKVEALARKEQPDYGVLLEEWERPDQAELFRRNYLAHLVWGTEGKYLADELAQQKVLLEKVTTRQGVAMDWLVEWANRQKELRPVRLSDFWGAESQAPGGSVAAAYTPGGAGEIGKLLDRIAAGAGETPGFAKARADFEGKYRAAYFGQWEVFLREFPKGEAAWAGREKRAEMGALLGGASSPYLRLLKSCPEALKPAVDLGGGPRDVPAWVPLLFRYERLRQPEYQQALKGGQGVVGKVASQGGMLLGKLWEKMEGQAQEGAVAAEDVKAFPYWAAFQESLTKMSERVHTPQTSYQAAKDTFAEAETGVGEPQQPVTRAYWSLAGLKRTLGRGTGGEEVFWQLLNRQADQVWSVLLTQSEAALQRAWEADVLAAADGLKGLERVDALQGPSGKVWEFQDKAAGPFLVKSARRRPEPKALYGHAVRFSGSFLDLLARGKVGQQAIKGSTRVQVSALPTDANPEAVVKPHVTRLILQCNSGAQELVNHNYPASRTFNWSAEECSDVSLEIGVGNAVLRRWYGGYDGFAKFLADFRNGRRVFRAGEFPEQKAQLAASRIETISVAYNFRGQEGVVGSAATAPAPVPDRIVP
jgi:type VI secretion system protein ImpL